MSDHESNGRQLDGRFAAGNKISKGNLGNLRMKELRRCVLEAATPEDGQAVIRKLSELGKDGDVQAARCYLEFVVGKPVAQLEVSGPDGASLDLTTVVATIMLALGDDQAARIRVAAAFRRLGTGYGPAAPGMGA
jgi:hypothetical protein